MDYKVMAEALLRKHPALVDSIESDTLYPTLLKVLNGAKLAREHWSPLMAAINAAVKGKSISPEIDSTEDFLKFLG